jgi:hypothetical protein
MKLKFKKVLKPKEVHLDMTKLRDPVKRENLKDRLRTV